MSATPTIMNEPVKALVALGAAIASNCEPCFKYHYDKACVLGVSREDMREAVEVALKVKAAPHRKVVETAERCLAGGEPSGKDREACGCEVGRCC
ncbi:MAG TPA: carboxymuconolactone decarboxylase family protein [Geobacteraceae bacterium]